MVDPHEIRVLARRMQEQGADVRDTAHALLGLGRALGWTGLAASAMAAQLAVQADVLTGIAAQHDAAVRALESHAAAVADALARIAEIERRVRSAVEAAHDRVGRLLAGLVDAVDPLDEALVRFVPPAPGSPQWLAVRVPGLALPGPSVGAGR
jgi:HPt (histidine-containing phosphotransfer) domain-containing protein